MSSVNPLPFERSEVIGYSQLLAQSFKHWLKRDLITSSEDLAQALYEAPFALVSHGTQADPVFRYANRKAQALWGMSWDEFVCLPSRQSAEMMEQTERQRLLEKAAAQGYVDDYRGVRIAKDGRRFAIEDTILWNVVDATGKLHGQAAMFERWRLLDKQSERGR